VLLDGFDELLQATGVSQTDYLNKVMGFQDREASLDRPVPVAILVTSRTAVADRAKPPPGMVVVRLEPFREAQISQWLDVWNGLNARGLASQGLRPLTTQVLLEHADLASQPLPLLLLALYDSDGNRLRQVAAGLHQAELYEQMLVSFAGREVRKSVGDLPDRQLQDAVELELLRLSVVAIAMFSRSRQWISDAELDADLPTLLGPPGSQAAPSGFRAPLSAAQILVGRFTSFMRPRPSATTSGCIRTSSCTQHSANTSSPGSWPVSLKTSRTPPGSPPRAPGPNPSMTASCTPCCHRCP
jgi:hypothetical protein